MRKRAAGDTGAVSPTGTERIADLADVGRAELEAERGVDAHGVEKLAADEFDARDVRLGRADVFLDERDAVDRIFEGVALDVLFQRIETCGRAARRALCPRGCAW